MGTALLGFSTGRGLGALKELTHLDSKWSEMGFIMRLGRGIVLSCRFFFQIIFCPNQFLG